MLATFLKGAKGAASLAPVQYIGSVTKAVNDANGWDTAGEALDVLSIAQTGDLVVIAFSFDEAADNTWSWNGMVFNAVRNATGATFPGSYIGYAFVQPGDANPYVTGVTSGSWDGLSIVASVFRNVSSLVGARGSGGAPGMPDPLPLNISPTVGRLWVIAASLDDDPITDWGAPTNYTLAAYKEINTGTFATSTAIAYRIANLTNDDPGAFSGSGNDDWAVALMAYA
jgi:hypothetical protein